MTTDLPYSARVRQEDEELERKVLAAAQAGGPQRLDELVRRLTPTCSATAVREAVWRLLNDGALDAAEDWRLSVAGERSNLDEQSAEKELAHAVG